MSKNPLQTSVDDWLAQTDPYSDVLDARSPAEFELDHIPGSRSAPVLSNDERVKVGTLYKQVSPFEARKLGGTLVARNIAQFIEQQLMDKPVDWKPLVYCWRGGQRSGALVTVLRQVGWKAMQLEGGYKAYRSRVVADLDALPLQFHYRVLCGPTGSGKSRLLAALRAQGAQVLDLEGLAKHRGSVLGPEPDAPQPSQKRFESALWTAFRAMDPTKTVWVEAESKKIGNVRVPDTLMQTMKNAPCVMVETPTDLRVQLLLEDYPHWPQQTHWLADRLDALRFHQGNERIDAWQQLRKAEQWESLVQALLDLHYDPAYHRSLESMFAQVGHADRYPLTRIDEPGLAQAAQALVHDYP